MPCIFFRYATLPLCSTIRPESSLREVIGRVASTPTMGGARLIPAVRTGTSTSGTRWAAQTL
ncbi:hypothetical protein BKE56_004165 [Rhodococcus sp. M8]|nr:hypothetical protein BKE56_004165 [Rhodococcus sp. M8]